MLVLDGVGVPQRALRSAPPLPEASDDEIRKAYRQWAQIYHPDKYQSPHMKDTATENFQRIREAYEILSDEHKRQIYDIYGMEGLKSGLELGTKLNKADEIKEEFERLKRQKEQEKFSSHVRPSGTVLANLSLPQYLNGGGIMRGMAMSSEVHSQISKRNTIVFVGGNLAWIWKFWRGVAMLLLGAVFLSLTLHLPNKVHDLSISTFHFVRHLSSHSTATSGITLFMSDGCLNLDNAYTSSFSLKTIGYIRLQIGFEDLLKLVDSTFFSPCLNPIILNFLQFGIGSFGASAHYTRKISQKSHGRVESKLNTALEFEIGGGRKISDFSSVRMLTSVGIQVILAFLENQLIVSFTIIFILLSRRLNALIATGAMIVPSSLYFLLKTFVVKPFYLKRERQKAMEKSERSSAQVREAREAASKAQKLLENVATRKKNKQMERNGLVITKAIYGNNKAFKKRNESREVENDLASQVLDVTVPLNFLVDDSGQLKTHLGQTKSGIMGFCDPSPEESKQLYVEYIYGGQRCEVLVDDYDELLIPQEVNIS
ncbi:hypothetical protein Scep_006967 [Stephania cephalantha]|uniref:J domain-containing protein n=1 Tax=Stephania cephalantha TaxID=152367 RepID=A0AAP0PNE2_9MAGN